MNALRIETLTKRHGGRAALDGIDDPMGEYMSSLGNRVDKLEHEVNLLQEATHPRDAGRTISE